MKTLSFILAFSILACLNLRSQSSDEDFSGFIGQPYQPEDYAYAHLSESAVYSQLEREVRAEVTGPINKLLGADGKSRIFNFALITLLLAGLVGFFSTFSRREARQSARSASLPGEGRQPVSKAS